MFACAGECVSVPVCVVCACLCVCVFSLCPGMPFLHRPHTLYSIPQGGPGLCVSGECQGERENGSTVSNATGVDTERKEGENTKIERSLPH